MIKKILFMLIPFTLVSQGAFCEGAVAWRRAAEDTLRKALAERRADVTRWEVQPLLTQRVEERLNEMDFTDAKVSQLGARSSIRIRGANKGRPQTVNLWYAVRGYRQCPVAAINLKAGVPLTQANVSSDQANVFGRECTMPNDAQFWSNTRAKHAIAPGDPICAQAIEPMPLVTRGETVAVKSVAGPVTITARGVAQEDGDLGKIMRIKNPGSGEMFSAAVSGRGEVVVRE